MGESNARGSMTKSTSSQLGIVAPKALKMDGFKGRTLQIEEFPTMCKGQEGGKD